MIKMLLQAFFPSWRFFEKFGPQPQLYFQLSSNRQDWQPWTRVLPNHRRRWFHLFLNPRGNQRLACNILIENFMNELSRIPENEADRLHDLVSYQLLIHLVRYQIRQNSEFAGPIFFRFKIVSTLGLQETVLDEALLSPSYEIP